MPDILRGNNVVMFSKPAFNKPDCLFKQNIYDELFVYLLFYWDDSMFWDLSLCHKNSKNVT